MAESKRCALQAGAIYCGLLTFSGLTPHVLRVLEGDRDFCGGIEIR